MGNEHVQSLSAHRRQGVSPCGHICIDIVYYKCIINVLYCIDIVQNAHTIAPQVYPCISHCTGDCFAGIFLCQSCCGGEFAFMRVCLRPLRWAVQLPPLTRAHTLNSLPNYQFSAKEPFIFYHQNLDFLRLDHQNLDFLSSES